MLAVVKLPVPREDAPPRVQLLVESCAGEGGHDGEARQVDFRLDREASGFEEHVARILIQAEDEAPLKSDPPLVQPFYDLTVARWVIETLVVVAQVLLLDRLQSHQETPAAATGRQVKKREVVTQKGSGQP